MTRTYNRALSAASPTGELGGQGDLCLPHPTHQFFPSFSRIISVPVGKSEPLVQPNIRKLRIKLRTNRSQAQGK